MLRAVIFYTHRFVFLRFVTTQPVHKVDLPGTTILHFVRYISFICSMYRVKTLITTYTMYMVMVVVVRVGEPSRRIVAAEIHFFQNNWEKS